MYIPIIISIYCILQFTFPFIKNFLLSFACGPLTGLRPPPQLRVLRGPRHGTGLAVTSLADKHSDHVLEQVLVSSVNKAFNKREEAKYNLKNSKEILKCGLIVCTQV